MKRNYIQPSLRVKDMELVEMIALSVQTNGDGTSAMADDSDALVRDNGWNVFGE